MDIYIFHYAVFKSMSRILYHGTYYVYFLNKLNFLNKILKKTNFISGKRL